MKNIRMIVVILLILLMPVFASARIGETVKECVARYGKVRSAGVDFTIFEKGGFRIMVSFYQGIADSIAYQYSWPKTVTDISDNEIALFLKSNGGDKQWKKLDTISTHEWETEDGTLRAYYCPIQKMLIIETKEYIDRRSAEETKAEKEKAEEEKKRLEGF